MENDISCIYKITNLIDNKIYIGSTKNLRKRKIKHISKLNLNYHHNSFLQKDYNTYGSLKFKFDIIEECTVEQLIEREQYYIDLYDCCNPLIGYNISPSSNSQLGFKFSKESKEKMSEAAKNRKPFSEETREKLSKANLGKKLSEEHKKKIGDSNKGKSPTEETREKMRKIKLGKPLSKEHKDKIKESMLKKFKIKD